MLVIGHRGDIEQELENSPRAFYAAVCNKLPRIELDIHLTKDHALCIMHDTDIARTTKKCGNISLMNRSEFSTLQLINGDKVPFLEETLPDLLHFMEVNVEIKTPGSLIIDRVLSLAEQTPFKERIIFSSFIVATVGELIQRAPHFRTALLWDPEENGDDPIRLMESCGAKIFHPNALLVTPELMQEAKSRGYIVYPWVSLRKEQIERSALWQRLYDLKVDGLCTNFPSELSTWLKHHMQGEVQR